MIRANFEILSKFKNLGALSKSSWHSFQDSSMIIMSHSWKLKTTKLSKILGPILIRANYNKNGYDANNLKVIFIQDELMLHLNFTKIIKPLTFI